MSFLDDVSTQLHGEIDNRLSFLATITDIPHRYRLPSEDNVAALAEALCGDNPAHAARACDSVTMALWHAVAPPDDWWGTPLGRACARSAAVPADATVTQAVAAERLGVTRGTVKTLVSRGTLRQHPDGGVLVRSVNQRLWSLRRK